MTNGVLTEEDISKLYPYKKIQYDIWEKEINQKVFNIKKAKFFLPHYPVDYISKVIVGLNNYFDYQELYIIDHYLAENAVICDIGANIGNHSIYWAVERKAKKIYAFEPMLDTFLILKTNIELNLCTECIEAYNLGLMDESCKGEISQYYHDNIGGTVFQKSNAGNFMFKRLDDIEILEKIDLIKIDVEGAEIECLKGGINTISKSKPVIAIETFNDKKEQVDNFMNSISYKLDCIVRNGEEYIYTYNP